MIESYNRKGLCVGFHDIQLFSAFLFFLLIPLKNTGIVHYVIWLGVIATTANVFFTLKNTGCKKKKKLCSDFLHDPLNNDSKSIHVE